ncbi:alpha/beta hydrolase [Streptomyces sp. NPDC058045]|uniref:alpha/beta hydrolase n=1 Tax=Streptomyces sp. NPDC058045 TaxID=3346311 RepID=UPI0036E71FB8
MAVDRTTPAGRLRGRAVGAALTLLLGTAVPAGAASGGAGGGAVPEAVGVELAARRAAAAGVRFGPCAEADHLDAPVRCGTVVVPRDYTRPDGPRVRLTLSRLAATGGRKVRRQGALVLAPGGPDGAGSTGLYFPLVVDLAVWRPMAEAYDLVGYEARGVGRSAPVSCRDPERPGRVSGADPRHPSAAERRRLVTRAAAYAHGCARRTPGLAGYTTRNNARDLEVLRAALGEQRLNLLGVGYGAYLGSVYGTLFPQRVRRLVLDSPPDPSPHRLGYRSLLSRPPAFETRWADFRTWVAARDEVYRLGATAEAVRRSYERVRAAVARRPAGGVVGPAELHRAFLTAAYYDDYWPVRALALSAFLHGDRGLLARQAGPMAGAAAEQEHAEAAGTAVACNDGRWPGDSGRWLRDADRLARRAPFQTWPEVASRLPCAFWPGARAERPVAVGAVPGALPPALVLAARRDAAAPYPGAVEVRRRLPGAVLVTERGAGMHGLAGGPGDCVDARLRAYLLTGAVPRRDVECAPHPAPRPIRPAR